jgi:hypothetical protein
MPVRVCNYSSDPWHRGIELLLLRMPRSASSGKVCRTPAKWAAPPLREAVRPTTPNIARLRDTEELSFSQPLLFYGRQPAHCRRSWP